jgi:hypothetical protein
VEIRFHNPYRYSLLGLLTEIAAFVGFLLVTALLALLFAALA